MKIISVASGKGGVGKTTFTANLGVALARSGQRVVLFDADLGLANLDVALGLQSEMNVQHVVKGFATISDAAVEGPDGVRVLTGGSGIASLIRLSRKRLQRVLEQIACLESGTDVLIFDTASGVDPKVMTFLQMANEVVLVTNPDPSSVIDAYTTAKVLFRYKKDASISVVVNRSLDENQAHVAFETIRSAARKFLHKQVQYLGSVREDPAAARIAHTRKAFVLPHRICPRHGTSDRSHESYQPSRQRRSSLRT
jgi:flagellar biosynthesis protein FlhG